MADNSDFIPDDHSEFVPDAPKGVGPNTAAGMNQPMVMKDKTGKTFLVQPEDFKSAHDAGLVVDMTRHYDFHSEPGSEGGIMSGLRGFVNGGTLGASNYIGAATNYAIDNLRTGGHGLDYKDHLQAIEQANDDSFRDHPVAYVGGNIAGAVATAGTGTAKLGTMAAKKLGGGLATRVLTSAAGGAAAGGIQGYNQHQDTDEAQTGAAVGGVVGAAAPVVIAGLGAVAKPIAGWVSKTSPQSQSAAGKMASKMVDDARKWMGFSPEESQAADQISGMLENHGLAQTDNAIRSNGTPEMQALWDRLVGQMGMEADKYTPGNTLATLGVKAGQQVAGMGTGIIGDGVKKTVNNAVADSKYSSSMSELQGGSALRKFAQAFKPTANTPSSPQSPRTPQSPGTGQSGTGSSQLSSQPTQTSPQAPASAQAPVPQPQSAATGTPAPSAQTAPSASLTSAAQPVASPAPVVTPATNVAPVSTPVQAAAATTEAQIGTFAQNPGYKDVLDAAIKFGVPKERAVQLLSELHPDTPENLAMQHVLSNQTNKAALVKAPQAAPEAPQTTPDTEQAPARPQQKTLLGAPADDNQVMQAIDQSPKGINQFVNTSDNAQVYHKMKWGDTNQFEPIQDTNPDIPYTTRPGSTVSNSDFLNGDAYQGAAPRPGPTITAAQRPAISSQYQPIGDPLDIPYMTRPGSTVRNFDFMKDIPAGNSNGIPTRFASYNDYLAQYDAEPDAAKRIALGNRWAAQVAAGDVPKPIPEVGSGRTSLDDDIDAFKNQ